MFLVLAVHGLFCAVSPGVFSWNTMFLIFWFCDGSVLVCCVCVRTLPDTYSYHGNILLYSYLCPNDKSICCTYHINSTFYLEKQQHELVRDPGDQYIVKFTVLSVVWCVIPRSRVFYLYTRKLPAKRGFCQEHALGGDSNSNSTMKSPPNHVL